MIGRSLRVALWLASALAVAGYLFFAIRALHAGAPADPVEAAVVEHATRIASGQPLYRDPGGGPEAAPMPGFPLAVSLLAFLFDPQVWEPRFLTLLATLLTAALIAIAVRAETESATLGAASAAFLLIGQMLASARPFAGRPESMLLLLGLAGFFSLRYVPGWAGAILASFLLAAGCFTHPGGIWFALAALLHLAVHDRRRLLFYAPALAVLVGGGQTLLSHQLGEWFNFSAWDAPFLAMRPEPLALIRYLGRELLGTFGVLTLATVLSFALPIRPWRGAVGIWTWMWFAALGAGMLATQSTISAPEALSQAVLALAVVGPVSIRRVTHHLSAWPGSSRFGGQGAVLTAIALQFLMLLAHLTPAGLR